MSDIDRIEILHFVSLKHNNSICGEDRSFIRCEDGSWFETNGFMGDRHDPIGRNGEDRELALMLEAGFWKTMYKNK